MENAPVEDVIRIREKQFTAIERMMALAETDEILAEQIRDTYKTDDMIGWLLHRLLNASHLSFAKLRENPEYIYMLDKRAR